MNKPVIALIGQQNSGKTTLFEVMMDIKSRYTGATFELSKSDININGEDFTLVDLPGINSLNPENPAEKTTYDFLCNENVDLIINVVNSTMLARSLELTVELTEFGLPMLVALNQRDEAEKHGTIIAKEMLEDIIGVPVVHTSALHGKGAKELAEACILQHRAKTKPKFLNYTRHLEKDISKLNDVVQSVDYKTNISSRYFAIKSIENPELVPEKILSIVSPEKDSIVKEIIEMHHDDPSETISYERHHLAMKISEKISSFIPKKGRPISEKLDDLLLHPIAGYFFMLVFGFMYFFAIYLVGNSMSALTEAPLAFLAGLFEPLKQSQPFVWYSLNGAFMGFSGIVGIVLPYFIPLILLTSIFESTGYISRIAFLVDGLMHKIGLHGKSVVPFILGFGCSVPALYATRLIENRRDRMITGVLIPYIPCSARIAVIFALTAAFTGPMWAMLVFVIVVVVIALSGKMLSRFLTYPIGMILEIPQLKLPSFALAFNKTKRRLLDFLKEAFLFLMGGSIVLGWLEYLNLFKYVNYLFAPILHFILGLPSELGSTLLFGFLRKELIIVMMNQAMGVSSFHALPLSAEQVIVFIIFVTLYFPCLTTFVVIWKEFGKKTALLSAVSSIFVATLTAFLIKMLLIVV